jgi:DNA-binding IclR family transcriptional regulator
LSFLDKVLNVLATKDGDTPISLGEISRITGYLPNKIEKALKLLSSIGLIEYDDHTMKAKIDPDLVGFIKEEDD